MSKRYTRNPGSDQVQAWKAALADRHKRQQRGRVRQDASSRIRPGMIRISPRTADDGDVVVVIVLPRWQIRGIDGRIAGPGDRALLDEAEARRLAEAGIVTILDGVDGEDASIPEGGMGQSP